MADKKLRKRDRALNVVKAGAKVTYKGFQKIQPVLKKVKPIINPRSAVLGFLFMSLFSPSSAFAAPNPIPDVPDLPGWTGNLTLAAVLATVVEETTYHTASMVPGSQWFNSKIGAPIAAVGAYGCAAGSMACHSVGWHTKGWKWTGASMSCAAYVVGAHRAAPHDPILTAARAATSPFETASKNAAAQGSA
tara:strand:- start:54 stop:626 length:573 start_codon:yes stop_codon:yes gene_type:complete